MTEITDINAAHSRNFEAISLEMKENAEKLRKIQDKQKYLKLSREMATLKISNVEVAEKVEQQKQLEPTKWRPRTDIKDPTRIHGEVTLEITIGNTHISHVVLVADIEDDLILGMDIMRNDGFELDFKRGFLRINDSEVILHRTDTESVKVVLANDTTVSQRSVMIVNAQETLDQSGKLGCGLELYWKLVGSMTEIIFRFTGIEILVCSFNKTVIPDLKPLTVTTGCRKGDSCKFQPSMRPSNLRRRQCSEYSRTIIDML
ncbi:hypothetical protein HHI36_016732 [Cryptolaemus montrouzieri]|uniref:Uncharacterized protein n=1 Tax=Cryptolaemus montrouzieri TaxID=559131 RepID=A0ABD2NKT3_9CUCU